MQPFGNVVSIRYGDEPYIRHLNGELYIPTINKKRERRRTVQDIKEQIDALPDEQKECLSEAFMADINNIAETFKNVYG